MKKLLAWKLGAVIDELTVDKPIDEVRNDWSAFLALLCCVRVCVRACAFLLRVVFVMSIKHQGKSSTMLSRS